MPGTRSGGGDPIADQTSHYTLLCRFRSTVAPPPGRGVQELANRVAMAAFCLAAAPSATLEPFGRSNRQELAAGWLAPSPQRHSTGRDGANLSARSAALALGPRSDTLNLSAMRCAQHPQRLNIFPPPLPPAAQAVDIAAPRCRSFCL